MTLSMKTLCLMGALALASGATGALAQDSGMQPPPPTPPNDMNKMGPNGMGHNMMRNRNPSMHMMPATVDSVDMKTGIVEVTAAGMALKVHFPPASVTDLKSGDAITLRMGFTKK